MPGLEAPAALKHEPVSVAMRALEAETVKMKYVDGAGALDQERCLYKVSLCAQSMYHRLHADSHLKHNGRLQLGLFLKVL